MKLWKVEQMRLYDFERGYCSILTTYKIWGYTIYKRTIKWSLKSVV